MSNVLACLPNAEASVSALPSPTHSPGSNSSYDGEFLQGEADRKGSVATPGLLRQNLRRSVLDGGYYGWMVGIGESYIPAFALAVGLGEVTTGLIASIPMLVGGVVQLASLRAIEWCGGYRRWIVIASACQAIAFLPLILAAFVGSISPWLLFLIVSCYWGSGMAAGPAWNAWISNVVPPRIRPRYFSMRTRLIQLVTFSGFLFGGLLIYCANRMDALLYGFAALFLLAAIARVISTAYLFSHQVAEESISFPSRRSNRKAMNEATDPTEPFLIIGKRLVLYLVCMQVFVQFSGPYFVPYMFKKLSVSYEGFVVLVGAAFVAKALAMPLWGTIASRRGGRYLLTLGGICVIPLSSLWTISDHFGWLILVQAASGALWSAYELGFFLVFLNDVPQAQRAKLMTIYNFANSIAWFCGSILGGWLLTYGNASYQSYHWLFWISSIGRLATLALLWRVHTSPETDHPKILRKPTAVSKVTMTRSDAA